MTKVKGLRVTLGKTQQDMADVMGISRQAYSGKETGKYAFRDEEKRLLKEMFKQVDDSLTIDDIFFSSK